MKHAFIVCILALLCNQSVAQTRRLADDDFNNSGAHKLIFMTQVEEASKLAQTDIENGTPFLLLQSGIAPVRHTTDSLFENEFKVYYFEQGCTGPDHELMMAYNQEVFEYLDDKFGKKWRKAIRKDVIGFKVWRRKN